MWCVLRCAVLATTLNVVSWFLQVPKLLLGFPFLVFARSLAGRVGVMAERMPPCCPPSTTAPCCGWGAARMWPPSCPRPQPLLPGRTWYASCMYAHTSRALGRPCVCCVCGFLPPPTIPTTCRALYGAVSELLSTPDSALSLLSCHGCFVGDSMRLTPSYVSRPILLLLLLLSLVLPGPRTQRSLRAGGHRTRV